MVIFRLETGMKDPQQFEHPHIFADLHTDGMEFCKKDISETTKALRDTYMP